MSSHNSVFCTAELNYVVPGAMRDDQLRPTTMPIRDGRTAHLPDWSVCGFELMIFPSAIRDWENNDEIAEVHYQEVADYAKVLTGCDHALVSSHIQRNPEQAARHPDLGPISFVHSDFAASYGQRIQQFYEGASTEAKAALSRALLTPADFAAAKRLVILQFWRNVGPSRMDLPLAFCDCRTVQPNDVRSFPVTNYAGGGFDFETLGVYAPSDPERHHWYAFPEMVIDEAVAFRTFDSDLVKRGEAFWTPHSAFRDPLVPLGQPARRSIELRATCLFY